MKDQTTPANANGVGLRTSEAPFAAADGYALPMRGDKYYWHTGSTVTVVRVDGSLTVVQTPAGSMVNVPTSTLMKTPKAHTGPISGSGEHQ